MQKNLEWMEPGMMHSHSMGSPLPSPPTEKNQSKRTKYRRLQAEMTQSLLVLVRSSSIYKGSPKRDYTHECAQSVVAHMEVDESNAYSLHINPGRKLSNQFLDAFSTRTTVHFTSFPAVVFNLPLSPSSSYFTSAPTTKSIAFTEIFGLVRHV